ncbi:hypothetical protein DID88_003232 [Monilinia fructigena]|uniref:Endoplasmic reticulum-Golgi intermediate compartment protein n=1 Tax=Monilinia fructigena TaxID=38457 RepID=A0A395IVZ4_9HELO|nr:hypothetical protein DID88_003232 [Monilinia fructigena]
MNGFADHGLDEGSFGEKGGIVKAFDAFPKARPQYITQTSGGGKWTVAMMFVSVLLLISEFGRWWTGHETHTFVVEKGIGHSLQVNIDIVIKMKCSELHLNVQDAAGDRILAGIMLKEDQTNWQQWVDAKGVHQLGKDAHGRVVTGKNIMKRGRFSHHCERTWISGVWTTSGSYCIQLLPYNQRALLRPFYPSLLNPLDRTIAGTPNHFHKYQYFLSIVPTLYSLSPSAFSPSSSPTLLRTNQYAVTSQEHIVGERSVPGIFFKYDIEPLLLAVEESRDGFLRFVVKIVNVISGVLVTGHWGFTITEWALRVWGRRSGSGRGKGMLDSGKYSED